MLNLINKHTGKKVNASNLFFSLDKKIVVEVLAGDDTIKKCVVMKVEDTFLEFVEQDFIDAEEI